MVLRIGHRGAMGYEPENTLRSFKKALALNVDMVELDVHVCKTGEVVVIHDRSVDRTTNGSGLVVEKTLDELKKLDAGMGERIPTLQEVLDILNGKVDVNIELKGIGTAESVARIIEENVTTKRWNYDQFLVSSFNQYELEEFRGLSKQTRVGILVSNTGVGLWGLAKKVKAYSIHINISFISREMVNEAHRRGYLVFVYTVNDIREINKMKLIGVDGIFSNYPDRV